jgi:hypothetical protein
MRWTKGWNRNKKIPTDRCLPAGKIIVRGIDYGLFFVGDTLSDFLGRDYPIVGFEFGIFLAGVGIAPAPSLVAAKADVCQHFVTL